MVPVVNFSLVTVTVMTKGKKCHRLGSGFCFVGRIGSEVQ